MFVTEQSVQRSLRSSDRKSASDAAVFPKHYSSANEAKSSHLSRPGPSQSRQRSSGVITKVTTKRLRLADSAGESNAMKDKLLPLPSIAAEPPVAAAIPPRGLHFEQAFSQFTGAHVAFTSRTPVCTTGVVHISKDCTTPSFGLVTHHHVVSYIMIQTNSSSRSRNCSAFKYTHQVFYVVYSEGPERLRIVLKENAPESDTGERTYEVILPRNNFFVVPAVSTVANEHWHAERLICIIKFWCTLQSTSSYHFINPTSDKVFITFFNCMCYEVDADGVSEPGPATAASGDEADSAGKIRKRKRG